MIETIMNGTIDVFTLVNILMIFTGCFIGIVFGAIPGLSTDLAVILFLPLTYSMDILPGILLLLGIYCGGTYGGSITAVLIGTPGTNIAMATVFDGHPLARKGKPRKALQMCLFASTIGGLISAMILLFTAPYISGFVLKFAAPEYFALSIFGISIIAGVSGNSMLRGIFMGCLGILMACVGIDASSGATRFSFGNVYLMKGLGLLPVLLGVFALPNILNQICSKGYQKVFIYNKEIDKADVLTGEERKRCMPIILKSTGIGSLIGAFTMKGLTPGPMLFRNQAPLMYAIMIGMAVANVAMFLEGKYLLRFFMKISRVPQPILFTGLALFCVAGSYSFSNDMFNVYILMFFGIIMYLLQKVGFPGAPFVLGIVLGPLLEGNLKNSLVLSDGSWIIFLKRPICVAILLITIFFTAYSIKKTRSLKKSGAEAAGVDEATALED